MSEHVSALKQVERDQLDHQSTAAGLVTVAGDSQQACSSGPQTAPIAGPLVAVSMSTSADAAYRVLFDNLRALTNGLSVRVLIFASVSADESARSVTAGFAAHAVELGLNVVTATMTESAGRAFLQRCVFGSSQTGAEPPLPLDVNRPEWQASFADWLRSAAPEADIVIIDGPPLDQSIDAAVLARACDGLVLVARTEVTPRQALQAAAERARAVGCCTLGVVMHGTKNHLPAWLRELGR